MIRHLAPLPPVRSLAELRDLTVATFGPLADVNTVLLDDVEYLAAYVPDDDPTDPAVWQAQVAGHVPSGFTPEQAAAAAAENDTTIRTKLRAFRDNVVASLAQHSAEIDTINLQITEQQAARDAANAEIDAQIVARDAAEAAATAAIAAAQAVIDAQQAIIDNPASTANQKRDARIEQVLGLANKERAKLKVDKADAIIKIAVARLDKATAIVALELLRRDKDLTQDAADLMRAANALLKLALSDLDDTDGT